MSNVITITKDHLDMRICDVEKETTNTETYREFIRNSEQEFGMKKLDIDNMTDKELITYIEAIDYLWTK